jgi:putative membrane protein
MWGYGPGSGYGMMGGYGMGYGIGPIGMIIWIVILIAVVVAVVWLVRSMTGAGSHSHSLPGPRRSSGLDVLEERYAKGEIQREEYLEKKKDIGG